MNKCFVFTFLILISCVNYSIIAEPIDKKVKIGVITALTGGMSTIGTAVKNGIELAKTEQPNLFSNIKIQYEDDQFDGKSSISAYRKLKSSNVDLILGFGSILANTVGPLTEADKIPFLNFNFEAESAIGKKYLIRSMNHTLQYMNVLGRYLLKKGAIDLPVVKTESAFFNAMSKSLKQSLGSNGNLYVVDNYRPGDTDFRPTIVKLKKLNPGFVGLFLLPDQLISFMKQSHRMGLNTTYFGTDLFETSANITKETSLFEGCLYPDNKVSIQFRKQYKERFHNEAQLTFAGNAYEIALLTAEVINRIKSFDRDNFLSELKTISERPSHLGGFSYRNETEFGQYFEFPVFVKSIQGSKGIVNSD